MTKIVICPGHYAAYTGVSKNNHIEYDEALIISEHVNNKLLALGYESSLIEGTLLDKVNKVNEIDPVLAVEIHLGNSNQSDTRGSRSFYMLNKESSKSLANSILKSCIEDLKSSNQGSWIGWYKKITPQMVEEGKAPDGFKAKIDLFLSKIKCPSAIIEPFFISSYEDCIKHISSSNHSKIADSIVSGIVSYLDETRTLEIRNLILKNS